MTLLSLLSASDVQKQLADTVRRKRKMMKYSRPVLSQCSTVPVATIKKFETTGQISLRQFILLWQCVDKLENLVLLTHQVKEHPKTIDDVLNND